MSKPIEDVLTSKLDVGPRIYAYLIADAAHHEQCSNVKAVRT